jgi:hypothetical protein
MTPAALCLFNVLMYWNSIGRRFNGDEWWYYQVVRI